MTQALEELSFRMRSYLAPRGANIEKKMFGGICYMSRGNMVAAAMKDGTLLARVGKDAMANALGRAGCHEMNMQGRGMTGFVVVDGDVIEDDDALATWLDTCLAFAATLPSK